MPNGHINIHDGYFGIGRQMSAENRDNSKTYSLLKVNVEISTFGGRSQGLRRDRNIASSIKNRIVLPL